MLEARTLRMPARTLAGVAKESRSVPPWQRQLQARSPGAVPQASSPARPPAGQTTAGYPTRPAQDTPNLALPLGFGVQALGRPGFRPPLGNPDKQSLVPRAPGLCPQLLEPGSDRGPVQPSSGVLTAGARRPVPFQEDLDCQLLGASRISSHPRKEPSNPRVFGAEDRLEAGLRRLLQSALVAPDTGDGVARRGHTAITPAGEVL